MDQFDTSLLRSSLTRIAIALADLGIAPEQEVRQRAVDREGDPADPNPMSWQFDFYKPPTTAASDEKEMHAMEGGLKNLVTVKDSEYSTGIKFFYFLRIAEFICYEHWLSR
jgi:hypothetical protein